MSDKIPTTEAPTEAILEAAAGAGIEQFLDDGVAEQLQDLVLDSADIHDFLTDLVELAAARFSTRHSGVLCAVTLLRPRSRTTVASSNDAAKKMDEVQYAFDDGPCLRAARTGQTVTVTDFRTETRFGGYPDAIADHGTLSALGVPIPLAGDANAGLNLYAPTAHHFTITDIAEAEALARQASKSLRMAVRLATAADISQHLKAAMDSRTTIDVAAGLIMGQNRCSHDTAITILKAASSGRNIKLSAVAASVIRSIDQDIPTAHFDS